MPQRIHLKKKRAKMSKLKILGIILVFVFIFTFVSIEVLGNYINPILLKYAQIETKRFASSLIQQAVTDELTAMLKEEELFSVLQNNEGYIQTIDFNPAAVTKVLGYTARIVQEKLKLAEEGKIDELNMPDTLQSMPTFKLKDGIVCEIPIGIIFGNSLLSQLGPRIPVRLYFLGDVSANMNTKIEPYGINNALVTVAVRISVTEQITMPLNTQKETIVLDIPIALKMVQGKVPNYYQNGLDKNSNIFTLPME